MNERFGFKVESYERLPTGVEKVIVRAPKRRVVLAVAREVPITEMLLQFAIVQQIREKIPRVWAKLKNVVKDQLVRIEPVKQDLTLVTLVPIEVTEHYVLSHLDSIYESLDDSDNESNWDLAEQLGLLLDSYRQ